MIEGIKRFRQAIENQYAAGEACFSLSIGEATAICEECEEELGALFWANGVPVPKDAEGVMVPLGTEELYTDDGEMFHAGSICFNGRSWYVFNLDNCKPCWLKALHRTETDSWEKLEEDVNLGCRDYCEKHRLEECDYNMRVHMLDRAKKLAGIEDAAQR